MGYPSPACLTCRKRRIKCDVAQPTCGRCTKADRRCVWVSTGDTLDLAFKSENAYAQGQPRRPRKAMLVDEECHTRTVIPNTLCVSTETHALSFWMQKWTDKPSDIPDIGHEYLTYIRSYLDHSERDSSLCLAVSAISLVIFGRLKGFSQAIVEADRYYTRVISKTQSDIRNLDKVDVDELMLATMLMTHYEAATYKHSAQPPPLLNGLAANHATSCFWKHVCHYLGTAGLLKAQQRQQQRQQQQCFQNISLYRAVRRPMIRAAILRGMTVQDWLCDATVYGEQGTALSLDRLMIRVANLRHKALQLRWSAKGNSYHQSLAVEHLHTEAQELDLELSLWPSTVTKDYGFHVRTSSVSDNKRNAPFYGNEAYIYTSFSHAAIWNRYRAVRIIVNNILVQTITTIHRNSSVQQHTVEELQTPLAAIRDLATDLRQSIPYYFNFQPLSVDKIIPKVVTTLAWPLTVAISIKTVPDDAIQCLRSTLRSVALALGDGVLESIAQGEDFEF